MGPQDLERIARVAFRELGAGDVPRTSEADRQPDRWRTTIAGALAATFIVRAGRGTSPQYIRQQIYDQWRDH
jgi:hypothetical protein